MSDSPTVLLVMDFQNGIVERSGNAKALEAARQAVTGARRAGIPVLFVRVAFRPGYPEVSSNNLSFTATAQQSGDAMTESHDATQVHASLEPRPDEPIVTKRRISAFSGSDL